MVCRITTKRSTGRYVHAKYHQERCDAAFSVNNEKIKVHWSVSNYTCAEDTLSAVEVRYQSCDLCLVIRYIIVQPLHTSAILFRRPFAGQKLDCLHHPMHGMIADEVLIDLRPMPHTG